MATPRWYRALLRLLPDGVSGRFGADLEEILTRRLARAKGPVERTLIRGHAAADLVSCVLREWTTTLIELPRRDGMGSPMRELVDALRALRASRLFSVASVATLGLGIGAAAATFSVVHAVVLKPLPYPDADRLVMVWPQANYNISMVGRTADAMPAVSGVTGISMWTLTLTGEGEPREVAAAFVSPGHFDLVGVHPALGRGFLPEEGFAGSGGVAVLSHDAWVRIFGADPHIVGKVVALSGSNHDTRQIVGVMPPGYRPVRGSPDLWAPLEGPTSPGIASDDSWFVNWRVARLAPEASLFTAQEQLRAFARAVREEAPRIIDEEDARSATIEPLSSYTAGTLASTLWTALGAVGLVLLIACANVANLLLARGEDRRKSLAVRAALGAGRGRIVRLLLAESGAIGVAGGALGVALAFLLVRLVVTAAPADFPRVEEIEVSLPVLGFSIAATLLSTLLAGLVPALRGSRVDATTALGRASRSPAGRARARLASALIAGQVALAVVVAVGSGLMLRSLGALLAVDPGVDGRGVLTFRASPTEARYPGAEAFAGFYGDLLDRLAAIPGVTSVGAIHILPGLVDNWSFPTFPEGVVHPEGAAIPSTNFRAVWPGYFQTVRLPVLHGRSFTDADGPSDEPVVVVNEAFAERWWPGEDPLGKTVRVFTATARPYRVVGVVADVRQHARDREPRPELYYAQRQWTSWAIGQTLVVRFAEGTDPLTRADEVRDAVWGIDPDIPVTNMRTLDSVLDESTRTLRFFTLLLSAFGGLAVALGAVGVFGVTAFTVGRRISEFGVRLALGSTPRSVVGTAVGGMLMPVGGGLAVGLSAAAFSSHLLAATLYGVEPSDALTFGAVAALLLAVGGVASLLPSWRAGRVDPVRVLNQE